MPSSICCTNCRTKYSLLNREAGCSKCALSFCKKCLGYRAILPNLSDQPMVVCYNCYQKLEAAKMKPDAMITTVPIPSRTQSSQPHPSEKNWWGEGLPPPSFRSAYATPRATPSVQNSHRPHGAHTPQQQQTSNVNIADLEQRRAKLREGMTPPVEALTIDEIEERLAKLRDCDVEVIRNPRSWLTSSNKDENPMNTNNPAELMRIAEDRARLEQKEEEMEAKDWEELEARRRQLFDKESAESGKEGEDTSVRESVVSGNTEFSEATKEEMNEINSLLIDAEKRCAETKKQEDHDASEMRNMMKATRQKSLDAMQWNEKITKEIGGFWDRRNEKEASIAHEEDDDDKSLDEETFKKILHEAENSPDEPPVQSVKAAEPTASSSPKKKGFFEKLFRKDSKQ